MNADPLATHRPRREPLWLTLVPAALVSATCALAAGVLLSIRDELPEQIASHWSGAGAPDGFSSFTAQLGFAVLFPLVMGLGMLGLALAIRQQRVMAPLAVGVAAFVAGLAVASTWRQRGVEDASTVRGDGPELIVGTALGLALALFTWLLVRRRGPLPRARGPLPQDAATMSLADSQRLAWTGRLRTGRALALVLAVSVLPSLVIAVFSALQRMWWLAGSMLLLTVLVGGLMSMCWSEVTIDQRGLAMRVLGRGWYHVPLENVEAAETSSVDPLGDFGGWGVRAGSDGRTGVVTTAGEALVVHRAGTGDLVVSLDDAGRAAAALNTLVARSRS